MSIIDKIPKGKQLILFDGVCNFCDQTINKIIKADKNNVFVFAPLQSNVGREAIKHIGVNPSVDSIILYHPDIAYFTESDAALEIAKQLGGIYSLLQLGAILPKALRNKIYQYIAKNRYKWYGKKDECMIPSAELRSKFLL